MIDTLYDKFKPWCEGGSIYIISDFHFENSKCKLIDSNWIDPQDQIDIINKRVFKTDTLICLGDVGNAEWISKLKVRNRILLLGNHDVGRTKYSEYFNEIYDGPLFISKKILLSHEPLLNQYWFNIHGHNHNGPMFEENGVNVAANVCNYIPINLKKDIIEKGYLSKVEEIHDMQINKSKTE